LPDNENDSQVNDMGFDNSSEREIDLNKRLLENSNRNAADSIASK
jgi:hypothetical protein